MGGASKRRGATALDVIIFLCVFGVIAAAGLAASFLLLLIGLGFAAVAMIMLAAGVVGGLLGYCAACPRALWRG